MKKLYPHFFIFISKRPILSFLIVLSILLALILVGKTLRTPSQETASSSASVQAVKTFTFGETATFGVAGNVEDSGVITLTAQTSGIVTAIRKTEGASITRGTTLLSLSDTYLGGTSAGKQLEIAQRNAQAQNEIAQRQIDINERNYDETPKTDDDLAKNLRADLKIQEQNALLGEDTAGLQEQQARIQASRYSPASPLAGKVERVHVSVGDLVSAGTPLVTISGEGELTATALLPQRIASLIDIDKPQYILLDGESITITPRYLSQVSTNDQNYSLIFSLDPSLRNRIPDNGFVNLSLTLRHGDGEQFFPLIPIDSVQITSEKSFVFVNNNGEAQSRDIILGEVFGNYVQIKSGLNQDDHIILDRRITNGDRVEEISLDSTE